MQAEKTFTYNPLDDIERLFAHHCLSAERRDRNEVVVEISGRWDNMLLFFAWEAQMHCLHVSCLINIEPDNAARSDIFELLALLNEDLWVGYFSYWEEARMPVFRHSVFIGDDEPGLQDKLSKLTEVAVTECEWAYPYFQAVLKQNISPRKALTPSVLM